MKVISKSVMRIERTTIRVEARPEEIKLYDIEDVDVITVKRKDMDYTTTYVITTERVLRNGEA